ncbi:MAG TPA: sugar ABC transporter permease [Chthonomonadaceae bacterium]|nr:sugar ABC transporter permease [Chthonomonadaceae bacterium]
MTRKEARQLVRGLTFLSPWIGGFLAFTLVPIVLAFYYSLCDYSLLQSPVLIGLSNYRALMGDPIFWKSLINTLIYAAIALPAGMLVSLGLAILLNQRTLGQPLFRTILFIPSLVPTVASAMLWLWLFNTKLGLINTLLATAPMQALLGALNTVLHALHLPRIETPIGWLTDPAWALPSLAIMSLWGVGYTVVIYLAGLQDVPRSLIEAAEIDGAGAWQRLRHVTLPMLSPVIFFNLIMAIIGTLQAFAIPYIMTGGGPARATYFYTMYLYDNAFRYLKMGYACSMAWIQFLLVVLLSALAFWSSKRWVHYQGQ